MKKLLVPTDFSPAANNAVDYATALAADLGAEILFLHAYHDPSLDHDLPTLIAPAPTYVSSTKIMTDVAQEADRKLKRLVDTSRWKYGIPASCQLSEGFPERLIPSTAKEMGCDLIVMGNRGQNDLNRIFFGSTTASVLRHSTLPVLAIPEHYRYRSIEHVMYASDFEPSDGWVVRQMLQLLQPLDFKLYSIFIFNERGHHYRKEDYLGLKEAMRSHMKYVLPDAKMNVLATGDKDLVNGLEKALSEKKVDVLVMATHLRNFVQRLIHPSQTSRMLAKTQVPLLAFPIERD